MRILDHAMGNGAAFCREFPPQELISLTTHETLEAAMCAEVANCNLWYGKLRDYRRVKGGRLNMVGDPPTCTEGVQHSRGKYARASEKYCESRKEWRREYTPCLA